MVKRQTPAERVAAYRARAEAIETKERLRALRRSPAWKATDAALDKMDEALLLLAADDAPDAKHRDALEMASGVLQDLKRETFGDGH